MGNQWSLYSWYTLPLFRVNSSVAFMRKGIYVARVHRILNLWRISKTSSTSWRSVCVGKVSAVLKKEWQYKNNQCQRSFLLSSNVDQSHSYLCPSPLLQWSCSHQRWQLWFCFKNISRSNFWWNCLPAMFGGRGRDTGEHHRRPYHRDQWACIQSQIWGGWYQSLVTFVTSVKGGSV